MVPHHIKETLEFTFGFSQFREGQEQTISQLLNGDSSLAIFPTDSGKMARDVLLVEVSVIAAEK